MAGRFDYGVAEQIARSRPPFDALIMAAVLVADTANMARLRAAFPALVAETQARYNTPFGVLPEEGAEPPT